MKFSWKKTAGQLIWALTVFLFVSFIAFETYTWGRYAYLVASVLILLLGLSVNHWRFPRRLERYHYHTLLFIGYTLISALWAWQPGDSVTKAITLFLTFVCTVMVYAYYRKQNNVQGLLDAVRWSGYIMALYAIFFYGLDVLILASAGRRMDNAFSNVNTIGMTAAYACVFQVHELLYKKSKLPAVLMIPCVLVIAASQSRKALVVLLLGIFSVYYLKNRETKGILNKIVRIIFLLSVALCLVVALYNLPVFDGVRDRMDRMIAGFLGESGADNSTLKRNEMVALGWKWFLRYPIGGIGIGNPHILAARFMSIDAYLHNNFIELLSGGGLLGFCIYYSIYLYLFRSLWHYRGGDQKMFEICFVWLLMMLIMDYGMVSYYSKDQWFYLMIHFLNVTHLKRKYREKQYAG